MTLYLSLLTLNPRSRQVQRELAQPYQMHRTILSGFPDQLPNGERVLYRFDHDTRSNALTVLIQSHTQPDWRKLDTASDGAGQPYLVQPPQVREVNWQDKIATGQRLAFRLRANPTKRLGKSAGEKHGMRVGLLKEEEQIEWLRRKGEGRDEGDDNCGFRLIHASVSHDEIWRDKREKGDASMRLDTVQFNGVLEVTHAERFVKALCNGIGSGKGFGCGLLSVARA